MNIFITGARGFIGKYAAALFAANGCSVYGLGHGHWAESEYVRCGLKSWLNGDVNISNLTSLSSKFGMPDLVIHLAGGSAVGPSFSAPNEDFKRSVLAASELVEWIRTFCPSTRLVMASSAAVYGAGHKTLIKVGSLCEPYSPYGYHKRISELILESSAKNFGLNICVVRLFSIYGNGLKKQLLWDLCNKASLGGRVSLSGTGHESRDWLHVTDAVRLLYKISISGFYGFNVFNGATGASVSVSEIAYRVIGNFNVREISFSGEKRSGDPEYLVGDTSCSIGLNFKPEISWINGVDEYVSWYKSIYGE